LIGSKTCRQAAATFWRKPPNGSVHKPGPPKPVLAAEPSATLRDQLIAEIYDLKEDDDLALWTHRRLSPVVPTRKIGRRRKIWPNGSFARAQA
jgi:hypothetical protein